MQDPRVKHVGNYTIQSWDMQSQQIPVLGNAASRSEACWELHHPILGYVVTASRYQYWEMQHPRVKHVGNYTIQSRDMQAHSIGIEADTSIGKCS